MLLPFVAMLVSFKLETPCFLLCHKANGSLDPVMILSSSSSSYYYYYYYYYYYCYYYFYYHL